MFKQIPKLILFSIPIFLCFFSLVLTAENRSIVNPQMWVTDSMERIFPDDAPGDVTDIELYGARGESEAFQIGIRLPQNEAVSSKTTPVKLTISDLSSSNGEVISQKNITLYQEHYIYVDRPSPQKRGGGNNSLGKGWYPDALIPLNNSDKSIDTQKQNSIKTTLDLKNGTNQPIWVDIAIPRDAIGDRYSGQFTVSSDLGEITGNIALKVWDFELPLQPSLDSSFLLWNRQQKEDAIELLKHKVMPATKIEPKNQKELIEQWGLKSLRLPFWSGANVETCAMEPAPSPEEIASAAQKNESELFLYVYAVDEIDRCEGLDEPLKEWGRNIHQAGYKHLAVMTPVPELYDYVDIWVVNPRKYNINPDLIADAIAKGQEVWFYNALVPENYSPKWQIDFLPLNYRMPHGFINQSLGMTGVLYWAVDYWNDNPWQSLDYPDKERNFPGEGQLLYPGEPVGITGIVPSMRLKWIREGVEDYEYIEILKQLGLENWALEISRTVGEDWHNWTKEPQKLASARIALGNKIETVSRTASLVHSQNARSQKF